MATPYNIWEGRLLLPLLMSCFRLPGCSNGWYKVPSCITLYEVTTTDQLWTTLHTRAGVVKLILFAVVHFLHGDQNAFDLRLQGPCCVWGNVFSEESQEPTRCALPPRRPYRCLWSSSRRTRPRLARLHSPAYFLQSCWSNLQSKKCHLKRLKVNMKICSAISDGC